MICVGYVGVEVFDIVLYIGQTLSKLRYPVLIVDLSDSGALKNTLYHGMDLDSGKEIIHYRNLNYIRRIPNKNELNEFIDGVVIVVFGLHYTDIQPIPFDYMSIAVNSFPHIIDKVNTLLKDKLPNSIKLRLLVRDLISLDDLERIKSSIKIPNNPTRINYLYFDITDYENAIQCQKSQNVKFRRISSEMKKIIVSEIKDIIPNIKESKIRRAAFLAGRGE